MAENPAIASRPWRAARTTMNTGTGYSRYAVERLMLSLRRVCTRSACERGEREEVRTWVKSSLVSSHFLASIVAS